jgi:hypothetical protein
MLLVLGIWFASFVVHLFAPLAQQHSHSGLSLRLRHGRAGQPDHLRRGAFWFGKRQNQVDEEFGAYRIDP